MRWPMRCAPAMAAAKARPGWRRCAPRFSPGYRDNFPAHEGARDLATLEELSAAKDGLKLRASAWRKRRRCRHRAADEAVCAGRSAAAVGLAAGVRESGPESDRGRLPIRCPSTRDGGWRQEAVILDFTMERADGAAGQAGRHPRAPGRRLPCRAAGRRGKRRLQQAGDRRGPCLARCRDPARRGASSCARPRSPSAWPICSRRWCAIRMSRPCWWRCSMPATIRRAVRRPRRASVARSKSASRRR